MDVLIERCCGLDVHLATVMACLVLTDNKGRARTVKREFSTMSDGLKELREWLKSESITHVAMESTGVYWTPIYSALEAFFDVTVANAQHVKKVPGRKTDMSDAEWLGRLLRVGLLNKSFIPSAEFRAIRDLTRARRSLVQDRTREVNRLHKVLVTANVKLSAVISDVFGVSGVQMVRALIEGVQTPKQIAQLAKGTMRKKIPEIARALDGEMLEQHRALLRLKLEHIDLIEKQIQALDLEIAKRFEPYQAHLTLLDTIPGLDRNAAEQILAEIGIDIAAFFANEHKLSAWSGVAPGNNQSAGKDLGARRRRGNIFMTTILVEAALAGVRNKDSYFCDKYHRLKSRRGAKRAALAIAHKIIEAVYRILTTMQPYQDLGATYLDRRDRDRTIQHLLGRLARLGVSIPDPSSQSTAEQQAATHEETRAEVG
jgi:transposase